MTRVLDLYDHPPADGRMVCVDEFGPLNLQPRSGRGWRPRRQPKRLRATTTARSESGTCSARWTWPPARSTTASATANTGWSSALRTFALNGTDHHSHDEQDTAIGTYIHWRNQHAEPVRDFAVGSKIRHPDYLPNVA
ncbi:hypothetical protein ACFXG4_48415 [Nocardia sp. NPDC059246]|uniref:hypothetical protein n=1 Tax=unclassified Nocardia TaxID=2637762 RepID=UPI0036B5FF29